MYEYLRVFNPLNLNSVCIPKMIKTIDEIVNKDAMSYKFRNRI